MKLNHTELKNLILDKLNGNTFVSMRTITTQTTLNKGRGASAMVETIHINPDNIKKHTDIVGLAGQVTFEALVNNRLVKEADLKGKESQLTFKVGERKWGTHVDNHPALVEYKDSFYLVLYCVANNKPKVKHFYEGADIDLKDSKFDSYRKPPKKEGENQGTENPIVVRDYKFDNIKEITILGNTYEVVPDDK